MSTTTDMAPGRSTPTRAQAGARGSGSAATTTKTREDELAEQIEQLQADIKSIGKSLAALAEEKVSEVQSTAKREVKSLARTGQHALEEVQDEFSDLERQMKHTIRRKPLTSVAGALALGFLLAVVTR